MVILYVFIHILANVSKILVSTDTGLQSAAPLLKRYAKVESLIISELNEFVITAPPQVVLLTLGVFFSYMVNTVDMVLYSNM